MRKSAPRDRRRRANAAPRAKRRVRPEQRLPSLAARDPRDSRPLLERLLDAPHLAAVVPQLQPEILHRVIQTIGLEDCSEIVALATPEQLMRVFDLDLWHGDRPGHDDRLDADRFAVWLEVLMEAGPEVAAEKLAGVDIDLVIAALAEHVAVFDRAAVSPFTTTDGDQITPIHHSSDGPVREVGGYLIEARRTAWWETVIDLLTFLSIEHGDLFNRVIAGCRSLSNSAPEVDGLDDLLTTRDQDMVDLAFDRERRREKQGYATPAEARTFLQMARQLRLDGATAPPPNPVTRAYFQALEWTPSGEADVNREAGRLPPASSSPPSDADGEDAIATVVDILFEAGVLAPPPRALLDAPRDHEPGRTRLSTHMQFASDANAAAYSMRTAELAYLANAVMAGTSIQERPFTLREASDAAAAICNLGLENWPRRWLDSDSGPAPSALDAATWLPETFLVDHDLVNVFQVGWTVLYHDVCLNAARMLITVLAGLRCSDRDIQTGIDDLRTQLTRQSRVGTPWLAREALDVIAILDMPAWAALLALIAECPVMHAALSASLDARTRSVNPLAFEFIASNSQIASIGEFLTSLPATLGG